MNNALAEILCKRRLSLVTRVGLPTQYHESLPWIDVPNDPLKEVLCEEGLVHSGQRTAQRDGDHGRDDGQEERRDEGRVDRKIAGIAQGADHESVAAPIFLTRALVRRYTSEGEGRKTHMKRNRGRKWQGFTLVELLVVIAIIGVISTIAFLSFNRARQRARDAVRVADMRQISSALAVYFNVFGHYPVNWDNDDGSVCNGGTCNDGDPCCTEEYPICDEPYCGAHNDGGNDPDDVPGGWDLGYRTDQPGDHFIRWLEQDGVVSRVPGDPLSRVNNDYGYYYHYYNPANNNWGCPCEHGFVVLAVKKFETMTDAEARVRFPSAGWRCETRDFLTEFPWAAGYCFD